MSNVIDLASRRRPQVADLVDDNTDFGERIKNIRQSLDKINELMANLKKMGEQRDNEASPQITRTVDPDTL
jgi:hypothetical protein